MARATLYCYSDEIRCTESRTEKLKRVLSLLKQLQCPYFTATTAALQLCVSIGKHRKFSQFEHKSTNETTV